MERAKRRERWDHTTALICEIRNNAFGRKGRRARFAEVHPMRFVHESKPLNKAQSTALIDSVFRSWKKDGKS